MYDKFADEETDGGITSLYRRVLGKEADYSDTASGTNQLFLRTTHALYEHR